jgi:hypothetical protein
LKRGGTRTYHLTSLAPFVTRRTDHIEAASRSGKFGITR